MRFNLLCAQLVQPFDRLHRAAVSLSILAKEAKKNGKHKARIQVGCRKRFKVLRRDGFRCVYCGLAPSKAGRLHVDHLVPKSRGGSGEYSNLVTSCDECNSGKSDAALTDDQITAIRRSLGTISDG